MIINLSILVDESLARSKRQALLNGKFISFSHFQLKFTSLHDSQLIILFFYSLSFNDSRRTNYPETPSPFPLFSSFLSQTATKASSINSPSKHNFSSELIQRGPCESVAHTLMSVSRLSFFIRLHANIFSLLSRYQRFHRDGFYALYTGEIPLHCETY